MAPIDTIAPLTVLHGGQRPCIGEIYSEDRVAAIENYLPLVPQSPTGTASPTGYLCPGKNKHGRYRRCPNRSGRAGKDAVSPANYRFAVVATAVGVAVAAVAAVLAAVVGLWSQVGDVEISAGGWIALALGVLVAL